MSTSKSKTHRKYQTSSELSSSQNYPTKEKKLIKSKLPQKIMMQTDQSTSPANFFSSDPQMIKMISTKKPKQKHSKQSSSKEKKVDKPLLWEVIYVRNQFELIQKQELKSIKEIQRKIQYEKRKLAALQNQETQKQKQQYSAQKKKSIIRSSQTKQPDLMLFTNQIKQQQNKIIKLKKIPNKAELDQIDKNNQIIKENDKKKKKLLEIDIKQRLSKEKSSENQKQKLQLQSKTKLTNNQTNQFLIKSNTQTTNLQKFNNQMQINKTNLKKKMDKNFEITQLINIKVQDKKNGEAIKRLQKIADIQVENSELQQHNTPKADKTDTQLPGRTKFSSSAGNFYKRDSRVLQSASSGLSEKQSMQNLKSSQIKRQLFTTSMAFRKETINKQIQQVDNLSIYNSQYAFPNFQNGIPLKQSGSIESFGYRKASDYQKRGRYSIQKKMITRIQEKSVQESQSHINQQNQDDQQSVDNQLNPNKVIKQAQKYLKSYKQPNRVGQSNRNSKIQSRYGNRNKNLETINNVRNIQPKKLNQINYQDDKYALGSSQKLFKPKESYIWNTNKLQYPPKKQEQNLNQKGIKPIEKRLINPIQPISSQDIRPISSVSVTSEILKEKYVQKLKGIHWHSDAPNLNQIQKNLLGNYQFNFKIQQPKKLENSSIRQSSYSPTHLLPVKPDPKHQFKSQENSPIKLYEISNKQREQLKLPQATINQQRSQISNKVMKDRNSQRNSDSIPSSRNIPSPNINQKKSNKSATSHIKKSNSKISASSQSLPSVNKLKKISSSIQIENSKNRDSSPSSSLKQKLLKMIPNRKVQLDNFQFPKLPGAIYSYMTHGQLIQLIIKTYSLFKIQVNDQNQIIIKKLKNSIYFCYQDIHIDWYLNGRFYIGGWKQNKYQGIPHGGGIDYAPEKYLYEGDFYDGKRNGFGTLKIFGIQYYQGQFQKGNKHGYGKYQDTYGITYEGYWKQGKREGNGKLMNRQKEIYEGQFYKNMKHGHGQETFKNGDSYKGEYSESKFSGFGSYKWQNGSIYEGQFQNGLRHGIGIWKQSQTGLFDSYQGEYLYDKKNGRGKYTWAKKNSYYQGQFLNDLKHGHGIFRLKNEKTIQGIWQNGIMKSGTRLIDLNLYAESQKQKSILMEEKQTFEDSYKSDSISRIIMKGKTSKNI